MKPLHKYFVRQFVRFLFTINIIMVNGDASVESLEFCDAKDQTTKCPFLVPKLPIARQFLYLSQSPPFNVVNKLFFCMSYSIVLVRSPYSFGTEVCFLVTTRAHLTGQKRKIKN